MLRNLSLLTITITFLLTTSGCRKNYVEEYPAFEGTWQSSNAVLDIDGDGHTQYEMYASSGNFSVSETAEGRLKIKDNELIIKSIVSKRFYIDLYPASEQVGENTYNHFMILDGVIYFKYPYYEPETEYLCDNGILDPGEDEIDCGGECDECVSCADSVMNQDETGIDCGGACAPCPDAPCVNNVEVFNYSATGCVGSNALNATMSSVREEIDTNFGHIQVRIYDNGWYITLRIGNDGIPVPEGRLGITDNFDGIDYDDEGFASIEYRKLNSSDRIISHEGDVFLSHDGNTTTATWCGVTASSDFYDCVELTGKVSWEY